MRPLTAAAAEKLPADCIGCAFWETDERLPRHCGAACDSATVSDWAHRVIQQWGDCGRVAYDDDGRVIGFIKYAPPGFFPQAKYFPAAPPSDDAVFIACLHVVDDARHLGLGKLLLHACMRDLLLRGERAVESYAFDGRVVELPVVSLQFLIQQGFEIVRPHKEFPLLRLNLKAVSTITENVESVLETLNLPLRVRKRAPAANMDADA
jgi:GNAT superfamily N-acetyltransferase